LGIAVKKRNKLMALARFTGGGAFEFFAKSVALRPAQFERNSCCYLICTIWRWKSKTVASLDSVSFLMNKPNTNALFLLQGNPSGLLLAKRKPAPSVK
jgi:hypothetical protein